MIGFLKSRALRNAAAKKAASSPDTPSPQAPKPQPPKAGEPENQAGSTEASAAETGAMVEAIGTAATSTPQAPPERYEARETVEGWSVHDRQTNDTAETYGYRLAKMNRSRAESLVEVLNRGEARRRGRNG
jgi:hypothetical protein